MSGGYWGTMTIGGKTVPWWHESFVNIHVPGEQFVDIYAGFKDGWDGDIDYPVPPPLAEPTRRFRACVAEAGYPSRIWHVSRPASGAIVAVCLTWAVPMPAVYGKRAAGLSFPDGDFRCAATRFTADREWCEATLFKTVRGDVSSSLKVVHTSGIPLRNDDTE